LFPGRERDTPSEHSPESPSDLPAEGATLPPITVEATGTPSVPDEPPSGWSAPIRLSNGLTLAFAGSYPKDDQHPDSNEDAWAVHEPSGAVAVFDGATESFAARRWVAILARQWREHGSLDLESAQNTYADSSPVALSWAQEQAATRGSFTTVAGLRRSEGQWSTLIVGDSAVLVVRDSEIVLARPHTSAADFASTPDALASAADLRAESALLLEHAQQSMDLPSLPGAGTTGFLLATDAVAAWLLTDDLQERPSRLQALLDCRTAQAWNALVVLERATGRMKVDDATVLVLTLDEAS
jgi:hypothetical protein